MSRWNESLNDPFVFWTQIIGIIVILALLGAFIYMFFALNTPSCIHGTNGC